MDELLFFTAKDFNVSSILLTCGLLILTGNLVVARLPEVLFLRSILFLHNRAVSRGGRASTIRLAVTEWVNETDAWP